MALPEKAAGLRNGQPTRGGMKDKEVASSFFKLGMAAANMRRDRDEMEQQAQVNMVEKAQIQDMTLEMQKMLVELETMQMQAMAGGMPSMAPPGMGMAEQGIPDMGGQEQFMPQQMEQQPFAAPEQQFEPSTIPSVV